MNGSIKKNLGLQTAFQIINTCLPLITAPYLARVLGASALGIYSYTSSIVAYFTLFAMLGTVNYGTRSIAAVRENVNLRSKVFWSIFSFQAIITIFCGAVYCGYMLFVCRNNTTIAWIQGIAIIACFFDITWLFFGMENFKATVTRSIVVKIITVILIILLVKKSDDLWLYTLIMGMGILISQMVLWIYVPKIVHAQKITCSEIIEHVKPNILLFIPLLAMSVYHIMDKTMLGLLAVYEESGFYYNADKIINIPLCIINGVGTVMLPRMTALYNSNRKREANSLFLISIEGVALVSIAMACGIAAISNEFIPFFFGKGYESCIMLTIVLSPVLVIKGFTSTIRTQYLVPLKLEKQYINSVLAGAVTNLVFNLLLIPKMGAMGAVIGTLVAELVACLWQFRAITGSIKVHKCIINSILYLASGLIMFFIIRAVAVINCNILIKLVIEIVVGGSAYLLLSLIIITKTKSKIYDEIFAGFLSRFPFQRRK